MESYRCQEEKMLEIIVRSIFKNTRLAVSTSALVNMG